MTLLADAQTMLNNGQTAPTLAASTNPANAMQDVIGNTNNYFIKLKEMKQLLTVIKSVTDAGDPNLTLINTALTSIG